MGTIGRASTQVQAGSPHPMGKGEFADRTLITLENRGAASSNAAFAVEDQRPPNANPLA
jgi:hypothetical protein